MTKHKPTKAVQVSVNVVTDGILDADTTYYMLPHDELGEILGYFDIYKLILEKEGG